MSSSKNFKSYLINWDTLDAVVSTWASMSGFPQAAYSLCRLNGSKDYKVVLTTSKDTEVELYDALLKTPKALDYFLSHGFSLDQEAINSFVCDQVLKNSWDTYYDPSKKRTQTVFRRITSSPAHSSDKDLCRMYWMNLLETGNGRLEDKIFKTLSDLMSVPATKESLKSGKDILKKIIERRPGWEMSSGLSLRTLAKNSLKWHNVLDSFGVSFKTEHNNKPLLIHAIAKGHAVSINGWCKETARDMSLVLSSADLPDNWRSEEFTGGSIWHLIGAHAPVGVIKKLSINDEGGFDVSHADKNDRNALHWACAAGNTAMVMSLLDLGLPVHQEDIFGKTPSEYLPDTKKEFDDLFDFLEKKRMGELHTSHLNSDLQIGS